ncbi:hypothetical protein ACN42_g4052 [Penicillium freii]|uniref:Uncharacterized protein n=1 Tax=Penicillium freii TaxID=48697 RepID=A0A117NPW6_PENFR|nr:hypothetical protein ACN42_g4052 [Penicillium freii]
MISVSATMNSTIPLIWESYGSYIKSIKITQEAFITERVLSSGDRPLDSPEQPRIHRNCPRYRIILIFSAYANRTI